MLHLLLEMAGETIPEKSVAIVVQEWETSYSTCAWLPASAPMLEEVCTSGLVSGATEVEYYHVFARSWPRCHSPRLAAPSQHNWQQIHSHSEDISYKKYL